MARMEMDCTLRKIGSIVSNLSRCVSIMIDSLFKNSLDIFLLAFLACMTKELSFNLGQ